MDSVEKHIEVDKKILEDPTTNPQQRRHIESELHDLEDWVEHHKEEIEAGDHHDPSPLELYCDQEPGAPECKIHDNWFNRAPWRGAFFMVEYRLYKTQ